MKSLDECWPPPKLIKKVNQSVSPFNLKVHKVVLGNIS